MHAKNAKTLSRSAAASLQRRKENIHTLQAYLRDGAADAFLITHPPHVRYLSGFTGSNGWLLLRKRSAVLLTDPRYREQVEKEVSGMRILVVGGTTFTEAMLNEGLLRTAGILGFESAHLPYATVSNLKRTLRPLRVIPMPDMIEQLRENKYPDEVQLIRRAIGISEAVWHEVLPLLRPGVSEIAIAAEITCRQRLRGADADAFPPIVLFGPRTSLIHGTPSDTKLKSRQPVLIDFGCRVAGYSSDITRTVFLGKAPARIRRIYEVVLEAQRLGREAAKPGMQVRDLDDLVRSYIADNGFGDRFEHGLGHGLGLEIHEKPLLSWRNGSSLEAGMVVTIEPGVYIPGTGGVRIEDDILITPRGSQTLTTLSRELLEL